MATKAGVNTVYAAGLVSLHALFVAGALAAVIMGGLSFALARKSPAEVMLPAATS